MQLKLPLSTKYRSLLSLLLLFTCVCMIEYHILTYEYIFLDNKQTLPGYIDLMQQFDIITHENDSFCDLLLQKPPSKPSFSFEQQRTNPNYWIDFTNKKMCDLFKRIADQPVWSSSEELNYSLAFSIMVFEDRQQVARLMRIIYRTHNAYCLHIDIKSSSEFRQSIVEMAHCFGTNVLIVPTSQSTDVRWGYYSVLEPSLTCAKMLLNYTNIRWKYLLNLNAKEFPILTNWELVRSIKALNGSNVAEATEGSKYPTWIPNAKFAFPIRWVKGYFLSVLRKELVQFMFTNDKAIQLLNIMQKERNKVKHPDEFLFPTLVYNPELGVPGACYEMHHPNEQDPRSTFVARYVRWAFGSQTCPSGRSRRHVCIFGVNDLHILSKRKEMFGNKFLYDFQPLALDCMEYWITKKILMEKIRNSVDPSFDEKFYSDLYCSKNHAP